MLADVFLVLELFAKIELKMLARLFITGFLMAGLAFAQNNKSDAIRQASLGVSLSQKQDYPGAIQAYRRALAIDPRLPNLYLNLGLAYFKSGRFEDALNAFQKEPETDQTVTLIGMSEFGLGHYRQAANLLQPLASQHPENSELGYLLAKCYLWAGDRQQATNMFRQLLERDPNSAPVHMLLAEALDADDREQEATSEFAAAVQSIPAPPEAHFGLGYLYWKQKQYPEAEREFNAELQSNPQHAPSLTYLGDLMLRTGRRDQALPLLKQAETLDPGAHVVHQDLGIFYADEHEFNLAVKEFLAAIKTSPDNYDSHYRLARTYQQMGQKEQAEREFALVQKLHEKKDAEPLMKISGPR